MVNPQSSPGNARLNKRTQNYFVPTVNPYNRDRAPKGTDYRDPSTGRLYPIHCEWRDTSQNDIWKLVDIASNVALWVKLADGTGADDTACSNYIVDQNDVKADYDTIQKAIDQAEIDILAPTVSGAVIFIKPGTYIEDLTITQQLNFQSFDKPTRMGGIVVIKPTLNSVHSITAPTKFRGITLATNGPTSAIINEAGSANIQFDNCKINGESGATSINTSGGPGNIYFYNCAFAGTGTAKLFDSSGGLIWIINGFIEGFDATPSTMSANACNLRYTIGALTLDFSGTAQLLAYYCRLSSTVTNTTILTAATTPVNIITKCILISGTATAIDIDSGTVECYDCVIDSDNATAAISGAGTLKYAGLSFTGTSSAVTTTTQNVLSEGPNRILSGTGHLTIPKGTELERPGTPVEGMIRGNTDVKCAEYYDGTDWGCLTTGSLKETACANYIVDKNYPTSGSKAEYATVQAAIDQAEIDILAATVSGAVIIIKPGTYTEDLVISQKLTIAGFTESTRNGPNPVTIQPSSASFVITDEVKFQNIQIATNGFTICTISTPMGVINFYNCRITIGTGITGFVNTVGGLSSAFGFRNCHIAGSGTAVLFDAQQGSIGIRRCWVESFTTTSTIATGSVTARYCNLSTPVTTSGTGHVFYDYTDFIMTDAECLTANGSVPSLIRHCSFSSGTATAIVIDSGTVECYDCVIDSDNVDVISGAGNLNYAGLIFTGTGQGLNVTTPTLQNSSAIRAGTGDGVTESQINQFSRTASTVSGPMDATRHRAYSSGTPTDNFGVSNTFFADNDVNTQRTVGNIEFVYTDVTDTSEESRMVIKLITGGTASTIASQTYPQAYLMPHGSTAQRPSPADEGMLRGNTDTNNAEYYDGTDWGDLTTSGFTQVVNQSFTGDGTYTPTSGMKYCIVEAVGGGGGGAGCPLTGAGAVAAGGGGGGGGYGRKIFSAATIGASQTVTIGTGGAGGVGNSAGAAGVTTTLGALLSCGAGSGGANAGASSPTTVGGGPGGTANGTINVGGTQGGSSFGVVGAISSGVGGASYLGGGAGSISGTGTSGNGTAGSIYGGGGAGAGNTENQGTARNGGAGAIGALFVTEFI